MKSIYLCASVLIYVLFWCVFAYLALFLIGSSIEPYMPIPEFIKTIGSGPVIFNIPYLPPALANALLIAVFGIQHSVMARPSFKRFICKYMPKYFERSVFVLSTCCVLILFFLAWQPINIPIWKADGLVAAILFVSFTLGCGLVLWATFMISHSELFGIAQAWRAFKGQTDTLEVFKTPALYKYSRHPMYLGILIIFWSTADMTIGHLIAASLFSIYIFIGIGYEEQDLLKHFGNRYKEYMQNVPQIIPIGRRPND